MPERALLLHLSDLHLCQPAESAPPATLRSGLLEAVEQVAAGTERVALAVTGDLIDSSKTEGDVAVATLKSLVGDLRGRGGGAPLALLPGNHDRRRAGVVGPWSDALVSRLSEALTEGGAELLAASELQPLAHAVDELSTKLGAKVVAYDSTHALGGKFSAGGLFRSEDLLAHTGLVDSAEPVVLLMHHHLVPTPVTDESKVDVAKASWWQRWLVRSVLPRMVTFADREELFMTALSAGTALTLLHTLGSPVIALHGHKHYPTARLLRGLQEGEGDVLLAAAGSAGLREPYRGGGPGGAHLRPSFNAVWFEGERVRIETVFFSAKGAKDLVRQTIADVVRSGARWNAATARAATFESLGTSAVTDRDSAVFTVTACKDDPTVWDYTCVRRVDSPNQIDYEERIEPVPGAMFSGDAVETTSAGSFVHIESGADVTYLATRALCRTVEASLARYGQTDFSPYEWVWLHVRGGTKLARLELSGLDSAKNAFASVTDLHTGREHPCRITRGEGDSLLVEVHDCPAKRLLRIYWPLDVAAKGDKR